jgi:hypothetical protein
MQYDLLFVKGGSVGRTMIVGNNQRLVLGRSRSSNIQINDPMVSRRHCEIANYGDGLSIFDLKSWNGTYVNGTRITAATPLRSGDRIVIGNNRFEVRRSEVPKGENAGAGARFDTDGSTHGGWRPEKGLPDDKAAKKASFAAAKSWAPDMVRGYHIDEKIGEGAVGTVFRATQIRSGRTVALKIVDPIYVASPHGVQRFLRAAGMRKELVHPNIIRIFDAGESEGVYYIAMEHIAGREVGHIISQYGRISLKSTLEISIQITAALQHSYEQSIVHRDIKPKNIMVNRDGVAKLIDLGLAKQLNRTPIAVVTAPGEAVGTLAYMPPEQLDDALNADHRSDIYSFGATIYHMASGEYPFNEPSFAEFVSAILSKPPPELRNSRPAFPKSLDSIIARAMAKDPNDRYQTPDELGADLMLLASKLGCTQKTALPQARTACLATLKDEKWMA